MSTAKPVSIDLSTIIGYSQGLLAQLTALAFGCDDAGLEQARDLTRRLNALVRVHGITAEQLETTRDATDFMLATLSQRVLDFEARLSQETTPEADAGPVTVRVDSERAAALLMAKADEAEAAPLTVRHEPPQSDIQLTRKGAAHRRRTTRLIEEVVTQAAGMEADLNAHGLHIGVPVRDRSKRSA